MRQEADSRDGVM